MNQEKQVCILRKDDKTPMRVYRSVAQRLIQDEPDNFCYTSKGATQGFYRRLAQTLQNEETLKNVDFSTSQKNPENFVQQEGNKIIGYRLRGTKNFFYTLPDEVTEGKEAAEKHKTWVQEVIERACINPNDQSLKKNLLAQLLMFFNIFVPKRGIKITQKPKTQSANLPRYQRYILAYGQLPQSAN